MIEEKQNMEENDLEDYDTVNVETKEENMDEQESKAEEYPNLSIKIEQAQYSIFELKRRYDIGTPPGVRHH